jgi:hypothetical protein
MRGSQSSIQNRRCRCRVRNNPHQQQHRFSIEMVHPTLTFIGLLQLLCSTSIVNGFDVVFTCTNTRQQNLNSRILSYQRIDQLRWRMNMFAPPGSGYASSDDYKEIYKSEMPDTYEPMMAFPGTMRPGKTPENMPFQDLPIGDDDPDPVPWPHFQQIEWHHRWVEPPHEHPGTMEDFIEALGRWATPEQEAAMRAGVRRDLRQRQETTESEKRDTIITDDDDDDDYDDDYEDKEEPVALGDGIFGKLGSDADRAATAAAVSPDTIGTSTDVDPRTTTDDSSIDDIFADDDLDDFLLDLGLDAELDDDVGGPGSGDDVPLIDDVDDVDLDEPIVDIVGGAVPGDGIGLGVTPAFSIDSDDEFLDVPDLDDDDDDVVSTVPLEDFSDSDNVDVEDIFDEGGFDYDDGDFGGNDSDIW